MNKQYESDVATEDSVFTSNREAFVYRSEPVQEVELTCGICHIKDTKQFIILHCSHLAHVKCIVEHHLKDEVFVNKEYLASLACTQCNSTLDSYEIMFMHSKYLSSSEKTLGEYSETIYKLEETLKTLKEEIRTCMEYENKLKQSRDKSRQIVSMLTYDL